MSDEYEHQSYWTTLNKRLNEEQESTSFTYCLEKDAKDNCLTNVTFVKMPLFCDEIKNENRQT